MGFVVLCTASTGISYTGYTGSGNLRDHSIPGPPHVESIMAPCMGEKYTCLTVTCWVSSSLWVIQMTLEFSKVISMSNQGQTKVKRRILNSTYTMCQDNGMVMSMLIPIAIGNTTTCTTKVVQYPRNHGSIHTKTSKKTLILCQCKKAKGCTILYMSQKVTKWTCNVALLVQ